jgi:hypothetical protein
VPIFRLLVIASPFHRLVVVTRTRYAHRFCA